jgi:hypothetical protein
VRVCGDQSALLILIATEYLDSYHFLWLSKNLPTRFIRSCTNTVQVC